MWACPKCEALNADSDRSCMVGASEFCQWHPPKVLSRISAANPSNFRSKFRTMRSNPRESTRRSLNLPDSAQIWREPADIIQRIHPNFRNYRCHGNAQISEDICWHNSLAPTAWSATTFAAGCSASARNPSTMLLPQLWRSRRRNGRRKRRRQQRRRRRWRWARRLRTAGSERELVGGTGRGRGRGRGRIEIGRRRGLRAGVNPALMSSTSVAYTSGNLRPAAAVGEQEQEEEEEEEEGEGERSRFSKQEPPPRPPPPPPPPTLPPTTSISRRRRTCPRRCAASGARSGQGLILVQFSAQPQPFWSHLLVSPCLKDRGEIMHLTYPTKCAYVEPKSGRV